MRFTNHHQGKETLRILDKTPTKEEEPNFIPAYDLLDVVEKIEKLGKFKASNEKLRVNDESDKNFDLSPSNDATNGGWYSLHEHWFNIV